MAGKKNAGTTRAYPKSTKYKGRTIKFSALQDRTKALKKGKPAIVQSRERTMKIAIDDKNFEVHETRDGVFGSILLPYSLYTSPVDLAQDVIDHVPAYRK